MALALAPLVPTFALCHPSSLPGLPDDEALPDITVDAHYDTTAGTTAAASQGQVQGALLQDMPLLRPGEVLETVPGLVVTQHSGDGKANQYFLRGFNLDHGTDLAIGLDAVPLNMPTHAHGQGYADLNFLIPEIVDHIDYAEGPYFAPLGDFATAGAADIHYRSSLAHDLLSLTAGTGNYRRLLVAASTPLQAGCAEPCAPRGQDDAPSAHSPIALFALERLQTDGPWVVPEGLRKDNGVMRLTGDGWSVDAMGYHAHWTSTDQVPLELIQSGELARFGSLDPSDGGESGRQVLSAQWREPGEDGGLRASAFWLRSHLRLYSNFTFYELRPATGDQFQQWEERQALGGELARDWVGGAAGSEHTVTAGLQVRRDLIDVGLDDTEQRRLVDVRSQADVRETAVAAYVQDERTWTDRVRSLAGLRVQELAMEVGSAIPTANVGSARAHRVLPHLAWVFGPWRDTELFLDWGRGFHSNDARGVIDRIDPTTGGPASAVPALVGAMGREIGIRSEPLPGWHTSLALWALSSGSEQVYSADSGIGSTEPQGASRRLGLDWGQHITIGRHLLIDSDFALTRARFAQAGENDSPGDLIPNAVPRVGVVRLTARRIGPWTGELEVRYIGAYPLTQDGSLTAPSSTVTNLRILRALPQHLDLSLDVLNAFNREYFDIAYAQDYQVRPTAPVVPTGTTVHPGEPRTLRLGLQWRF